MTQVQEDFLTWRQKAITGQITATSLTFVIRTVPVAHLLNPAAREG